MLPLANLVGHAAVLAGVLAILMGTLAAVVLRFAAGVPVVLTFLVLHLALPVLPVAKMLLVVIRRRLRDGRHRRPHPENQNRRDHCDLNFSHTDLHSSLPQNQGTARRYATVTFARGGG